MNNWAPILKAGQIEANAFARACADPKAAQLDLLKAILRANQDCEFGRTHGFDSINDFDGFRSRVPIRRYAEMLPWIDRIAHGELCVLSNDPVIAFEETGGSTGGRKLIPYTAAALRAFRAAVLPWLYDLSQRHPGAFAGKAYVAVSPATRMPRTTPAGHPIGLPSEGAYLGADLVTAFAAVAAVPAGLSSIPDVAPWRFATLLHLLKADRLTLISVWSPTFLIVLMDALADLAPSLGQALHDGWPSSSQAAPADQRIAPDPERARHIETALSRHPIDTAAIWPHLDTISAWADGSSRVYARRLQAMFPHAALQPKGLLATEGAVTTPWGGLPYSIPALTSSVVEFVDDQNCARLCHELTKGETYRVAITTPGGLYRYDLGDRVLCHAVNNGLPRLEFVSRADVGSDLVGEKLTEEFVVGVLSAAGVPASLVAHPAAQPFYELVVHTTEPGQAASIVATVERGLCRNPQYSYARKIGQLGPLRARAVPDWLDRIVAVQTKRGLRLADIKPPSLICDDRLRDLLTKQVDDQPGGHPSGFLPAASSRTVAV